jgi:hypothetical protein
LSDNNLLLLVLWRLLLELRILRLWRRRWLWHLVLLVALNLRLLLVLVLRGVLLLLLLWLLWLVLLHWDLLLLLWQLLVLHMVLLLWQLLVLRWCNSSIRGGGDGLCDDWAIEGSQHPLLPPAVHDAAAAADDDETP